MAFAGLDVGTSSCKLAVYDLDGREIFRASRGYREQGGDGRRELDPETVLSKVKEVLKEAGESCPEPIEAMSVASLGESAVLLDENGKSLAASMLTGDLRGIGETKELTETLGAERIFQITGLPPNELYGLPKYMWLNRHTDAVKRAAFIFFYEDYVGYMLTGRRRVSYSSAARSMAFDIGKKEWNKELLALAGIRPEQMSQPSPPCTVIGTISEEAAKELSLNPGLKLVTGGHDQSCAALGSGLLRPETAECGMGTCEFMFAMLPGEAFPADARKAGGRADEWIPDAAYMIDNNFTKIPYLLPGTFLTSLEITTCGALKNWARDSVFSGIRRECRERGENFFAHMETLARNARTDVLVLPQFGSAGNPDLSMDARGTIAGLTIHTRPEEIYRAILEGFSFQLCLAYERLEKLGARVEEIAATGGGAASELTLQIRADVFGKKVFSLKGEESGTLGCMIMAAVGAGAYSSLEEGIRRAVHVDKVFLPDMEMHEYYKRQFKRYKKLYESMHSFR